VLSSTKSASCEFLSVTADMRSGALVGSEVPRDERQRETPTVHHSNSEGQIES